MLTVNNQFPGPEIRVKQGDSVNVTVVNKGNYGVTIHWHGVRQPRNPWTDGPMNITQCPIPPNTSFIQNITFTTEEGTLWWHAHSDWSRATVHGAIIIEPAEGTLLGLPQNTPSHTIVLSSWYNGDVMEIGKIADTYTGQGSIDSDASTINGLIGHYKTCPWSSSHIVNAVMNQNMFLSIARHNLTVVGMDGAAVKPINTNYIMISPGNTMDALLTANQDPGLYYVAATSFFNLDNSTGFDNSTATALLKYDGDYSEPAYPAFPHDTLPQYNDTQAATKFRIRIRGNVKQSVPQDFKVRYYITNTVTTNRCHNSSCTGVDNILTATFNNISFITHPISILQAYYENKWTDIFDTNFPTYPPFYFNFTMEDTVPEFLNAAPNGTHVIMVEHNDVVEIVLQGTSLGAEDHPIHLHGHSFFVIGRGHGNFDPDNDPMFYNLDDPPLLNTVTLPKRGWAAIRFQADNPGVWYMHCHLERHATWGMATVLVVKDGDSDESKMLSPPHYMPPCSAE
ncbi:Laccase-14 like [Actinidia chinensis var. chinensis]|uniref:Laccase n=1 Tax=Actinidia chinensis var. chinensis TaxID=1590841 RepID=A0A2R6P3L7_ACTCC|nr:Laccase-14 like [Actinidia chinensis var. chinensis]